MKLEDKLYIPSIEELHIGIEFYTRIYGGTGFEQHELDKYDFAQIYILEEMIESEELFLRELDEDDILDLDFIKIKVSNGLVYYEDNEVSIYHNIEYNLYEIENEYGVVFKGYIKNKSELKRLLRQTNG